MTLRDPANYHSSSAAWSIGSLGAVLSTSSRLELTSTVTLVSLEEMPLPNAISHFQLTSSSLISSGVALHETSSVALTSTVTLGATGPRQLPDAHSMIGLQSTIQLHETHITLTDYLPTAGFLPIR